MNKPHDKAYLARRQENEARFTYARILELHTNPVQGSFNVAHLKEIHRRIFQDLPILGYDDIKPGQYRPPVAAGQDWLKVRQLETVDQPCIVAYSSMDQAAQQKIDQLMQGMESLRLKKLSMDQFTKALGEFYIHMDYLHPFADGNSRTLRVFTQQVAIEAGFQLDWEHFAQHASGRDQLYIARDLSVNALALEKVQDPKTKRELLFTLDVFEGNPDMRALIKTIVWRVK